MRCDGVDVLLKSLDLFEAFLCRDPLGLHLNQTMSIKVTCHVVITDEIIWRVRLVNVEAAHAAFGFDYLVEFHRHVAEQKPN